jgi:UDP-N-acetylglucosamine:LPS N-acetylglucosamine transferase
VNSSEDEKKGSNQRMLAVASGGGHWIQLLRMTPAFAEHDLAYVTTLASYRPQVGGARFYLVRDANRWNKFALLLMAMKVFWILVRERPRIVISTGAAPGYFALRIGKLMGARTIWVDSIANVEKLSMSGQSIGRHADLWLTQWPHLARPEGPHFCGAVL